MARGDAQTSAVDIESIYRVKINDALVSRMLSFLSENPCLIDSKITINLEEARVLVTRIFMYMLDHTQAIEDTGALEPLEGWWEIANELRVKHWLEQSFAAGGYEALTTYGFENSVCEDGEGSYLSSEELPANPDESRQTQRELLDDISLLQAFSTNPFLQETYTRFLPENQSSHWTLTPRELISLLREANEDAVRKYIIEERGNFFDGLGVNVFDPDVIADIAKNSYVRTIVQNWHTSSTVLVGILCCRHLERSWAQLV